MFEICREEGYERRFRVVYFAELGEHNREIEISRAMAGSHVHDGFITEERKEAAKQVIASYLERWNGGEAPAPRTLDVALEAVEKGQASAS